MARNLFQITARLLPRLPAFKDSRYVGVGALKALRFGFRQQRLKQFS